MAKAPIPTFPRKRGKEQVMAPEVWETAPSPVYGGGMGWGQVLEGRQPLRPYTSSKRTMSSSPR